MEITKEMAGKILEDGAPTRELMDKINEEMASGKSIGEVNVDLFRELMAAEGTFLDGLRSMGILSDDGGQDVAQ